MTNFKLSAVALSSNKVFIAHSYSTQNNASIKLYGVVCTINGTTMTAGTETQLNSGDYSGYGISAVALSSNKVFIAHSSAYYHSLGGTVCTISDTIITVNAYNQIDSLTNVGNIISTVKLSSNKVFIAYSEDTHYYLRGAVCTINDTSISYGSRGYILNNENSSNVISVVALSSSKVFIAHSYDNSNYYLYGVICTIDGMEITTGIDTQLSTTAKSGKGISTILILNNKVLILHSCENSNYLYGLVCTISGTTITASTDTQLSTAIYSGSVISGLTIVKDKVFIAHSYTYSFYLYGIVTQINSLIKQLENSTDQILGIANIAGTENGLVQVYVPKEA